MVKIFSIDQAPNVKRDEAILDLEDQARRFST